MQLLFLGLSAFLVGFSGAMMPGPLLTATIGEAMRRGWLAGPLIALGHAILEIAVLLLVVWGLGRYLEERLVIGILGLVGGAVLLWMGWGMMRGAVQAVDRMNGMMASTKVDVRGPIRVGILTSLSNPYFTLWWATIGLNYAATALQQGTLGLGAFYIGHISADFVWYTFVSVAVASGRRWCSPVIQKWIIILCGLLLILLGLWFFRAGILVWL